MSEGVIVTPADSSAVLERYPPAVDATTAQTAAAAEHAMMAVNGTSALVAMNDDPGG